MPALRIHPRFRSLTRTITGVLAGGATLTAGTLGSVTAAHADGLPGLNCNNYTLSVAITDPGPANQTLWGQLCYRGPNEPGTVQLLVHGLTYSHTYWDFPYGNGYSQSPQLAGIAI